jgi:hypothetical protein
VSWGTGPITMDNANKNSTEMAIAYMVATVRLFNDSGVVTFTQSFPEGLHGSSIKPFDTDYKNG